MYLLTAYRQDQYPQILSMKVECTFLFLNFLIFGLCHSSGLSLLEIFSFLTVPPEFFFFKKFINHWSKYTLISIIFRIFSNTKCFITQCFIRSCSSCYIFKISLSHGMLKTCFIKFVLINISRISCFFKFLRSFFVFCKWFKRAIWKSSK